VLPAAALRVLGVLCGFLDQCWNQTAGDADGSEEERDCQRATHYEQKSSSLLLTGGCLD